MAFELDAAQRAAVDMIADPSVGIGVITGGAGTGKTTTLRAALDRLDALPAQRAPGLPPIARYLLAAPTGKAARRMCEAVERDASTIHRLLKYKPGIGFSEAYINARVVIVDEASMVDVELGQALLSRIHAGITRVFFVGDANQLPSVGPGRFFADIIESGAVPVVKLQTVHRAEAQTWMVAEAPKIIDGIRPDLEESASFGKVAAREAEAAAAHVVRLAKEAAAAGVDAQVLSPQSNTPIGVDALNMRLQQALNPSVNAAEEWRSDSGFCIRDGDRVMQTKNDYERDVMNGETGVVLKALSFVSVDGKKMPIIRVDFGTEKIPSVVTFDKDGARSLRLAYAMSIHKSQGSQYDLAIVVCHSAHSRMLSRQLLYTAVTRAKKRVVLVGNGRGLSAALENTVSRNTELGDLMKGTK